MGECLISRVVASRVEPFKGYSRHGRDVCTPGLSDSRLVFDLVGHHSNGITDQL